MSPILALSLIIVLSYLIGSFPTAYVISKTFFGFDIRKKGSGNMGSTNVFRTLGWKWGVLVQIVDLAKGLISVLLIANLFEVDLQFGATYFEDKTIVMIIAGMSAVIGHILPVYIGFRGGKGINTAAGMLFGIAPIDVSIAFGIFILAVIFSGYISLGSILGAVTFPSSLLFRYNFFGVDIPAYNILIYFSAALALLLIYAHKKNIKRLIEGRENRFKKLHLIKLKKPSD